MTKERCDKGSGRQLIESLGRTHLFDATLVHDRDRVGHGHGFFLVVGDVQEGEAHLALDVFEFQLHLAAEFEIQSAKRFI